MPRGVINRNKRFFSKESKPDKEFPITKFTYINLS